MTDMPDSEVLAPTLVARIWRQRHLQEWSERGVGVSAPEYALVVAEQRLGLRHGLSYNYSVSDNALPEKKARALLRQQVDAIVDELRAVEDATAMTYRVLGVVGRGPDNSTDYDEAGGRWAGTLRDAVRAAGEMPGTKDVFGPVRGGTRKRLARVHVDGGIDYYESAGAS